MLTFRLCSTLWLRSWNSIAFSPEKLKNRAIVLGYYFSSVKSADGKGRYAGALPKPVLPAGTFKGKNIQFTNWVGYGGNLEEFQQAARSAGHFNPWPDEDGVIRRVPISLNSTALTTSPYRWQSSDWDWDYRRFYPAFRKGNPD